MNRILLVYSFDKISKNAIFFVSDMFDKTDVEVTLFYFIGDHHIEEKYVTTETTLGEVNQKLILLIEKIKRRYRKLTLNPYVIVGDSILKEIKKYNELNNPLMIVMGIPEKSFWQEINEESLYSEISRKVNVPLMIIPEKAKCTSFKQIVMATDFKDFNQINFQVLFNLYKYFKFKLTVVNVVKDLKRVSLENLNFLINKIFKSLLPKIVIKENNDVTQEIINEIKKEKSDLLILVPEKKEYYNFLFHKCETKELIPLIHHIPLLLLKHNY